jgi:hypothetical protein
MKVGAVLPDSPAERAGLRPGDRIVAINGQKLENLRPFYEAIVVGQRDVVELTVEQPDSAGEPRRVELVLRPEKPVRMRMTGFEHLLNLSLAYYPLGFLIVGVGVLLFRPDDRNAWLLALIFGGFIAGGPLLEGAIPPHLRGLAVFYKIIMASTPQKTTSFPKKCCAKSFAASLSVRSSGLFRMGSSTSQPI